MAHPSNPEFNEAGECVSATDWLGNRFAVGDLVIYCIGAGRGQLMALGRVTKMFYKEQYWNDEKAVTVQVLTERTSGSWDNEKRTRTAMVNPLNVTAVRGLEASVL